MTQFDDFYAQKNNTSVEVEDSTALDQCMDLVFAWLDVLKIPRDTIRHQYAYQVWANPNPSLTQYFTMIPNSVTNVPLQGDVVVFKACSGIPVGHISLETGKSDTMNLVSFDQNWDTLHYYHVVNGIHVPYCRTVVHAGYYGVYGWLHPKFIVPIVDYKIVAQSVKSEVNSMDSDTIKVIKIKGIVQNV